MADRNGLLITYSQSRGYRAEGTRDGYYRTVYAATAEAVTDKWHSQAPNEWVKPDRRPVGQT